jgi:hypothetical protein
VSEGDALGSAGRTARVHQHSSVLVFCGRNLAGESIGELGGGPVVEGLEAVGRDFTRPDYRRNFTAEFFLDLLVAFRLIG